MRTGSAADVLGSVFGSIWDSLASGWVAIVALFAFGVLVVEMGLYARATQECGARTQSGSRCRRPVAEGSATCGQPGHTRGWVVGDLVLALLCAALAGHALGIY